MDRSLLPILAVSEDEVKNNFNRFGLLDERLVFLPGWFKETLPESNTGPLSILRIDCDLYSSTMTVLDNLYGRVSPRGWVIVDDYGVLPPCRKAVDDFRERKKILEPIETVDKHAIAWQLS